MQEPILSLCLPTNGIIEWVFPVLDSIYNQNVDKKLFEVIVTNNGDNQKFDIMMCNYEKKHENLIYKKNNAYMFYNQLEALKLANGEYLKFINHRGVFYDGALIKMINIIRENRREKPIIFFGNGVFKKNRYILNNFNEYVCTLKRYASWTTGVGIWKDDYKKISENIRIDMISPHSCILFSERKREKYLIENLCFSRDIEVDESKKGKYDLFKAFAVEEVMITLNLFIDGDITAKTFKIVKKDYGRFVAELYWKHIIKKIPCSYNLSGFDEVMGIFFSKREIIMQMILIHAKRILKKIVRK